jgi:hypothetical protein
MLYPMGPMESAEQAPKHRSAWIGKENRFYFSPLAGRTTSSVHTTLMVDHFLLSEAIGSNNEQLLE